MVCRVSNSKSVSNSQNSAAEGRIMDQEEERMDIDMDVPIVVALKKRKKKTTKVREQAEEKAVEDKVDAHEGDISPRTTVSLFDSSVENHFKAVDTISKLCGEPENADFDPAEIDRLRSSVTFLREWSHFKYPSRTIRFACRNESKEGKDVFDQISLPQFSSATVPKTEKGTTEETSSESCKDYIMYVGGPAWALDWCPRVNLTSDFDIRTEFIAVASHPPDSTYHKIGAPLTGRGVIQIWCLLNQNTKKHKLSHAQKKQKKSSRKPKTEKFESDMPRKPRGRPRKYPLSESGNKMDSSIQQKPRGRPRKHPVNGPANVADSVSEEVQPLAIQCLKDSSALLSTDVATPNTCSVKDSGKKQEVADYTGSIDESANKIDSDILQKPKGRPRKCQVNESAKIIDSICEEVQPLAMQCLEDSSVLLSVDVATPNTHEHVSEKDSGLQQEVADHTVSLNVSANKIGSNIQQKPRGRPRRRPINESANKIDSVTGKEQPLAIQCLEDSSALLSIDKATPNTRENASEQDSRLEQEVAKHTGSADKSTSKLRRSKVNVMKNFQAPESALPLLMQDDNGRFSSVNSQTTIGCDPDLMRSKENVIHVCGTRSARSVPKDVSLPRMVLCLAHNGKVAWDLKWRPSNVYDKQRMGYLAVLLGNGALEVWEVPFPQTVKGIYSCSQKEDTDPRFIKLQPVFRCSALKCSDRQSIPLTLEWSSSSPHDMILAGCHDGVVALWKFSPTGSSVDTRPLLCFSADTVPIRALSWAPVESYSEGANVIVTAGHKGLKFWDIRDPFHPLWDFPLQKIIYSLDWLTDPSCVIVSLDDGSIRFPSLLTSSNDIPVSGTPFVGSAVKGLHSYSCSSFPIWSIQASRLPGCIAYCSADGTALHFQLTAKAVEKDPARNRAPHFLCGSLKEEESTLTVFTPLRKTPFPMKRSSNEWGDTPRSIRGLVTKTNQEKRAKEKMADKQTTFELPALCYDDEQGMELGSDDTMVAQKSKQATKPKTSRKNNSKADELGLVCTDSNPECVRGKGEEVEEFPPKIIAMHRVRWNKNQGSENWLCFGGAAGILRCQEIDICDL